MAPAFVSHYTSISGRVLGFSSAPTRSCPTLHVEFSSVAFLFHNDIASVHHHSPFSLPLCHQNRRLVITLICQIQGRTILILCTDLARVIVSIVNGNSHLHSTFLSSQHTLGEVGIFHDRSSRTDSRLLGFISSFLVESFFGMFLVNVSLCLITYCSGHFCCLCISSTLSVEAKVIVMNVCSGIV